MRLASKSLGGAEELPSWDREVLVGSPRVDIVCAPHVDHQPSIVGAVRLLSAAQLCGAAAFTRRPRLLDQLLDAGTLIFRKTLHGQASSLSTTVVNSRTVWHHALFDDQGGDDGADGGPEDGEIVE